MKNAFENMTKEKNEYCSNGEKGYTQLFLVQVKPFSGFSFKVLPEIAIVDDPVSLEITADLVGELKYTIDFGDDTLIPPNSNAKHTHIYRLPGLHRIKIFVDHVVKESSNRKLVFGHKVFVTEKVLESDVTYECAPLIEPEENANCTAALYAGQDLTARIDFDDGVNTFEFNITGVKAFKIGPQIPNEWTLARKPESDGNIILSDVIDGLSVPSSIRAVEGYGHTPGDMELVVYRPVCENDDCSTQSRIAKCPQNSKNDGCKHIYPQYKRVRRIKVTSTRGYFFVRLMRPRIVKPGDLITFESYGGIIATKNTEANETADLTLNIETKEEEKENLLKQINSQQIVFKSGKKFLISVYMNEEKIIPFPHSYSENRMYNTKFMIASKWAESNYTLQQNVNVEKSIGKLKLRTIPPNAIIGSKVDVILQMTGGSNVGFFWNFGDGTSEEEVIATVNPGEKIIKSHIYQTPGVYTITVSAKNVKSIQNVSYTLKAEYPVNDYWELASNSPQLLPGIVTFSIAYPFTDLELPTNATAYVLFGDGSTMYWQIPEKHFPGRKHVFKHEYKHSGRYRVTATLKNIVSSVNLKTEVYLQHKIEGFRVNYGMLQGKSKIIEGFGPNRDRYPINRKIAFYFDVETGDVHKYIAVLNGQAYKETTDKRLVYTSKEPGWRNFSFTAFNDIQNQTEAVTKSLYFMRAAKGLNAVEEDIDLSQPAFKKFLITFEEQGTDTCLTIDYGEHTNDTIEAYGELSTCEQLFADIDYIYEGPLTNPLNISHTFKAANDYTISVKAGNQMPGMLSTTFDTTVIEIDCKPPLVEIKNVVTHHENCTEFWRSKPVQLYAKSAVDCNASAIVTKMWLGFLIDPESDQVLQEIDLSSLDSYRKTFLYIPPFFLQKGVYRMRFAVNISSTSSHPLLPFYEFQDTYIRVVPSPIIGQMSAGSQSRIIRGWGQKVVLAPGNYSLDPDDYNNKNFNITWFCRRVPGENLDREIPDNEQLMSKPIYDRNLCPAPSEDQGGCFGKGAGIINITGGEVVWNTTYFYKPGMTYEVIVRIDPPDRESSWAGIQLVLMERSPPSLTVKCQTEPLCYPNVPIGQKINPVRVGLIGVCSEDCEGELTYEWSIYGVDSTGNEVLLPQANEFVVGANEEKMALGKEFFDQYYPKYGDFFARLAVINEEGDRGESDIFLHINQPPEAGECLYEATGSLALLDKFHISCSGWIDPEGKPVEYYAFWVRNLNTGILSFLMYGPDKQVSIVLPLGNFTIGVDIKDKEGSLTRLNVTDITTQTPTIQQYEMFMDSKQLENADTAGDQSMMNMISQAISSLMNVDLPDESEVFVIELSADGNETMFDGNETTTVRIETTTMFIERNATKREKSEKDLEAEAKTRAKMVKSVSSIMNVDTLNSLEQIGSVLTAISGEGKGVDNEAKDVIIKLLNKTVSLASSIQVESPQQLLDFCMYAVGTMGGIVNRMTEQIVTGVVLPTDREKAWELEYSVEAPAFGEEKDYIFDGKSSTEESLAKAVVEHERKEAEAQIKQMIKLTIDLVLAMLKNIVVGEKPLEFAAPSGLSLTISMFNGGGLTNKSITHGDAIYTFPEVCSILVHKDPCFGNETLGVMAVSWPSILESFGNSVDLLSADTKTLQLMLLDDKLDILDISDTADMFTISVPRKGSSNDEEEALPPPNQVTPKMKWYENMVYHQFLVEKADSAVNIEISPINLAADLLLFINHRYKPMINHYEILIPLRAMSSKLVNNTYDIFLGNDIIRNRTGFFYLGVAEVNADELLQSSEAYLLQEMIINENISSANYSFVESNYTIPGLKRNFSTEYGLRIFTSGCYFYNYKKKLWSGEGCYVEMANKAITTCKCNHLTSFGSGFFVMPNTVDFTYVFAHAGFADNVTIYMTIVISLTAYILLLIWARKNDRKDLEALGATPLADNDPKDKYLYEITVYTGDKEGAATDSNINFILSGDDDETDVRLFSDSKRKIFRRGAQDSFVMAVPRRLGRLNYCRIWHDNSGKGKFRSWFLSFITVRDVQTAEKFEFICNKWLAVERGDGNIDRLLPVAGRGEATQFTHLFHQTTQKNLKDGHLWFSIFMRPPRSRFTRVQRVSCCMALLFLSMLVNAMWYERVPPKPKSSALEIGPFALSPEQIGVGFFSNLIVFPPTFLIVLLFRKSRLRVLRPSRIQEALKKQGVEIRKNDRRASNKLSSTTSLVTLDGAKESFSVSQNAKTKKQMAKKKKKFMFPWWCRYIAWALCILSMIVSVFFLWAYGIQFGDEKTRKWVTSLIVSFFASILVTQPVKVLLTAMILSTIFKSPDSETDDSEEDEEEIDLELAPDEEWLHSLASFTPTKRGKRSKFYRPPNLTAMEKAKLERLKELKMSAVLKEIWSYLVFLWILIVLSYGNRDPNAFFMKDTLHSAFIEGSNSEVSYSSVRTTDDLWQWINATLIPELRIGRWYNGYQAYGLRGFLNDKVNRMMGYAVLRQVRIKENTCKTAKKAADKLLTPEENKCRSFAKVMNEDRKSYGKSWTKLSSRSFAFNETEDESEEQMEDGKVEEGVITRLSDDESIILVNPAKSKKNEWEYRKSSELDGLPFWGKLDVYSGGGYVVPLRGSQQELQTKVKRLKKQMWIDERTRAVFAEFSVYNPQVNLFAVITIVGEFQPGGGVLPNYRIEIVRLINHHQGFGLFVIICELSFVAFIVYFTIREFRNWRRERHSYFGSYWNWAEIFVILASYSAVVLYFYRLILTYKILKIFDKTHGNAYIKLQFVAQIDELFGYIMAFTIFIGILKFIRLLRFNKRMGILYSTLHQCSKDLKSFCTVFLLVFFAFVQMFYLLFGLALKDFSSLVNAAETTFGMVTGKFDFDAMCAANRVLGPITFFIFVLIAQIILINVFLTLIISAFETVKHDIGKQSNEFEIVSFMMRKAKELLGIDSINNGDQLNAGMERQDGINTIEEQLNCFPEKVDRLLHYINDLYFDGELKVDSFVDSNKSSRNNDTSSVSKRHKSPLSFSRVTPFLQNTADNVSIASSNTTMNANQLRIQKRRAMRKNREVNDGFASQSEQRRTTANNGQRNQFVFDWREVHDDDKF
ncbi:polycystic kidney disease protein 1-like protein 2-like protein [Leptotrombidium deliense]|uniref:Polycystic kidney disease protein 1-like protein 2-like protein n=1 Tax=Leptotrombidium deliense TaxID=299467 RepID=A0A443SWK0_9ACAR|nr:polycystic kidney disease protein 1-like protein 2-like protein [Leptotrombidium deliense]